MKTISTIILAAAAVCALVSCNDKPKNNGKLDPSAKVYITAAKSAQAAPSYAPAFAEGEQQLLTPLEVIEQAVCIYTNNWILTVGEWNRDIENVRFVVGADWAITQYGDLSDEFLGARDYIFVTFDEKHILKDTIAYIANDLMAKAEKDIKAAYDAENYPECYRLLQEAFVFTPTTGAIYRELKQSGKN